MKLGVCSWRVAHGGSVAAWADRLRSEVKFAASNGAELLVFPEYSPLELTAGEAPDLTGELMRAVDRADDALDAARDTARAANVWLLPGTMPFRTPAGLVNRAPLISPTGLVAFQDKHVLTRFEAEQWGIAAGRPPAVFETDFGRLGIAICFDAEFPPLVRAQVDAGAWAILVPSCTDTAHGFNRVRLAAAARAMENQCFSGIAPTVGQAPWCAALDANRGTAMIFGPVDRGFPEDGVLASGPPDAHGWAFAHLDPSAIERVRRDGAVFNHVAWPAPPPACAVASPA